MRRARETITELYIPSVTSDMILYSRVIFRYDHAARAFIGLALLGDFTASLHISVMTDMYSIYSNSPQMLFCAAGSCACPCARSRSDQDKRAAIISHHIRDYQNIDDNKA